MRVLWVYDTLTAHQAELATRLASRSDLSLEIICRWHGVPPIDRSLIPLTNLTCRSKIDFRARQAIRVRLQTGQFDIVNSYTSRTLANVLAAARGIYRCPKIIGYRGTVSQLRKLDPANWITFWHPRLSKIVCVAEATRLCLLRSGVPASRLVTVWEGSSISADQSLPRSARSEFGVPANAFVVGLVANMRRVKGVDLLLRAALELADIPDIYWLLIGDVQDSLIRELAQDPRIADRVRLPGPRAHGGRFASLFDLYASPSRMEGMPMAIMEAMGLGICPVTTAVGGCPELVRDRLDGLVVPPEDVSALARAIRFLHANPKRRTLMAASAQKRVTSQFSIDAWADRLADVYRDAVMPQPARAA